MVLLTHRVAVVDATRWRAFLIFVVAAPAKSTEALARFVLRLLHRVGRGSQCARGRGSRGVVGRAGPSARAEIFLLELGQSVRGGSVREGALFTGLYRMLLENTANSVLV